MARVETYVEVDVDLDEFSDEDLLDELESRGLGPDAPDTTSSELVGIIYEKRRMGKAYEQELDQLIYQVTGRII